MVSSITTREATYLRRRLISELATLKQVVCDWNRTDDPVSQYVEFWRTSFQKGLKTRGVDEVLLYKHFKALLIEHFKGKGIIPRGIYETVDGGQTYTIHKVARAVNRWLLESDHLEPAPKSFLKGGDLEKIDQMTLKLLSFDAMMRHWGKGDAMTCRIDKWREGFMLDLHERGDFTASCEAYFPLLQKILVDDAVHMPLDPFARYGSDGHTYANLVIKQHEQKSKPPYNERSPLYPQDPTPFTTIPHPITRYADQLLTENGYSLYTEEVQDYYLARLKPTPVELSIASRIKKKRKKKKEEEEIETLLATSMKATNMLIQRQLEKCREKKAAFQSAFAEMRKEDEEFVSRLKTGMKEESTEFLHQIGAYREKVFNEEETFLQKLQGQIDLLEKEGLDALSEKIDAFNELLEQEKQFLEVQMQEKFQIFQANIMALSKNLEEFSLRMDDLEKDQEELEERIARGYEQLPALRERIAEIERANEEVRRKNANALLTGLLSIGLAACGTWLINAFNASAAAKGVIIPKSGGASVYANLRF